MDDGLTLPIPPRPEFCPRCKRKTPAEGPFCECKFDLYFGTLGRSKDACIYCGETGRLTDEHILPAWLQRRYPNPQVKGFHRFFRPKTFSSVSTETSMVEVATKLAAYEKKVMNVCSSCNTGWMSTLQTEAQPLLIELIEAPWRDFTETERVVLARWASMTTLSAESYANSLISRQYNMDDLKSGRMPNGWHISITKLTDKKQAGQHRCLTAFVPIGTDASGEQSPLVATLLCVENVAFYSLNFPSSINLPWVVQMQGLPFSDANFRKIWPSQDVLTPESNYKKESRGFLYYLGPPNLDSKF